MRSLLGEADSRDLEALPDILVVYRRGTIPIRAYVSGAVPPELWAMLYPRVTWRGSLSTAYRERLSSGMVWSQKRLRGSQFVPW